MISNPFRWCAGLLLLFCFSFCFSAWGEEAKEGSQIRFFRPTPGFTLAKNLPDSFKGKVEYVDLSIQNAFDGAPTHSEAEDQVYALGNKLHVKTLPSTIWQRLLFRRGDTVTADLLRENEKNLRGESFLADAIVEVKKNGDSTIAVKITTYDQWTTSPALGLSRKGGEWTWFAGLVESNVLGTGQQLGFILSHDLQRDSRAFIYNNNSFSPYKLQATGQYSWLSDGSSYSMTVARPLLARTDKWGFTLSATDVESSEYLYLSGNDLNRLNQESRLDSAERFRFGQTNLLGVWGETTTDNINVSVTRAFGYSLKTSVAPFYSHESRHDAGAFYLQDTVIWDSLYNTSPRRAPEFDARRDEILGLGFNLYQYSYKTVHNFRNLKWSENLETGWRLSAKVGRNETWLGARNSDWLLSYAAVYKNAWMDRFFFNTSASLQYFLSPDSGFDNGSTTVYGEAQWKPITFTSTVLTGQYDNLFATTSSQRLYLGGESGLNGFPNYYFSGKARVFLAAEQRYFPPFEFGTFVPAFAVFLNAGNTYSSYDATDLHDLHYAAGIGLRLGQSRSVQKVVNHIDISWPLGEENLGPWSFFKYFSIVASKNL